MKIFRLEEANALLGVVRPLLEKMVRARRDLAIALLEADVAREMNPEASNGHGTAVRNSKARELQADLLELVDAIGQHGCIVKDLDLGLVDFPALRGGQLVNLCWKMDEPTISFWHGVNEGFTGRKSLSRRRA
jgi:hypothetical protein